MDTRGRVKGEIEKLHKELAKLKAQGPFLSGVRVERTAAGGTASQKAQCECKYARLRAGKGKLLDNGKKSQYIPVQEIDKYQEMCNRGKSIKRLERKIEKLQQSRWRRPLKAIALRKGQPFSLPEYGESVTWFLTTPPFLQHNPQLFLSAPQPR